MEEPQGYNSNPALHGWDWRQPVVPRRPLDLVTDSRVQTPDARGLDGFLKLGRLAIFEDFFAQI